MVQRKRRSGAACGRGGAHAAAQRLRTATGRGALRGDASASLPLEQCLLAASGRDAANERGCAQAETSPVAWQRDVTRCVMPFAGVSVIADGKLCLSTTSEMIVAGTDSGYHLLMIEGYSHTKEIPNGKSIRSRPFMVGGHRWRIDYMPNGDSPCSAEFISFYVVLLDDNVVKPVKAQFEFSWIDQVEKQEPTHIRSTKACIFRNHGHRWGDEKFLRRDAFEKSKYLKGDWFTIRCDIIVCNCKDLNIKDASATEVPQPDLRQHLNQLLQTKVGADVTFNVSGETFAAHRCVLAARSTVFMAQLFGPMKEGTTTAIVFGALLSFIYTDLFPEMETDEVEVEVPEGQEEEAVVDATWLQWLQDLFVAADRYDLQGLKFTCEELLREHTDVSSVTSNLAIAEKHHCRGLKEACLQFLQVQSSSSLQSVMATSGWEHITKTYPSVLNELISKLATKF